MIYFYISNSLRVFILAVIFFVVFDDLKLVVKENCLKGITLSSKEKRCGTTEVYCTNFIYYHKTMLWHHKASLSSQGRIMAQWGPRHFWLWGPPSYNVIQIIIFRSYAKLMQTKLVHLLYGYLILIIIIAIFPPAPFGQPGCQFHFKWKSQARGWKIFQEWSQNVAFWVILLSKKWRLEGGGKCPPCPFQNWHHWGVILSITVVKLYDILQANLVDAKHRPISDICGMSKGTKP